MARPDRVPSAWLAAGVQSSKNPGPARHGGSARFARPCCLCLTDDRRSCQRASVLPLHVKPTTTVRALIVQNVKSISALCQPARCALLANRILIFVARSLRSRFGGGSVDDLFDLRRAGWQRRSDRWQFQSACALVGKRSSPRFTKMTLASENVTPMKMPSGSAPTSQSVPSKDAPA